MDVLKPKIVRIEGRCYRHFESKESPTSESEGGYNHSLSPEPYVEDSNPQDLDDFIDSNAGDELDVNDRVIEIKQIEGGKYKHSFYVPSPYFGFIIGANGATKKKLEGETGTFIKIPRMGKEGEIVITSSGRRGILSARHRIDLIVESSTKKLRPTHYLAIPLQSEIITENYDKFKKLILNETAKDSKVIKEELFQTIEKMHLTIGVMLLLDNHKIEIAIETLKEHKEKILKPMIEECGPIKIRAQGLDCMNDDPSKTKIIYAKISSGDNDHLQDLVDKTVNFFNEKGLIHNGREKVKLHMTVMHSGYLVDRNDKKARYQKFETFDATSILKEHGDFLFGEVPFNTIELRVMGEKDEQGYAKVLSRININE